MNRRIAARIVFFLGIFLMLLGSALLLSSMTGSSRLSVFTSFLFVIIGSICAVFAIKLNRRSLYLFFAAFFILTGFFLFLSAMTIIPAKISQLWPLISVFAGLALIPAGWRHYGSLRTKYIVPSVVFMGLGCMLLIFSFDVVPFSFSRFMLDWWPLLIALAGLILFLLSFGARGNRQEDEKK